MAVRHWLCKWLVALGGSLVSCAGACAVPVYHGGHADIVPLYLTSPSRLELRVRLDGNSQFEDGSSAAFQQLPPEAVAIRVPDPAILRENYTGDPDDPDDDYDLSGSEWDFLGVDQGEPLWFLPQTNAPGKPFFGFATDTLLPNQWNSPIRFALLEVVTAPSDGEISLWQTDFFGGVLLKFASADGIDAADDSFTQTRGGHDHYNWGFSQPGTYKVRLGVSGTRVGGGEVQGSGVFTFLVGNAAVEGLAGDYNRDGVVDAADYTVWRNTLGQTGPGLAADGDQNGEVNGDDYLFWKERYGNVALSTAGLSGVNVAVPEPSTLVFVLASSLGLLLCIWDRTRN